MARFRDFSIALRSTAEADRPINLRFQPFVEAIRWGLGGEQIKAPWSKLAVALEDAPIIPAVFAKPVAGVTVARLPVQAADLRNLFGSEMRRQAAQLTSRALDLARDSAIWDDDKFRAMVAGVGGHVGPFRRESTRLRTFDRKAQRQYQTVFEMDDEGITMWLECRDADGSTLGATRVRRFPDHATLGYEFDPRRLRLDSNVLEYLDSRHRVIASTSRPDC